MGRHDPTQVAARHFEGVTIMGWTVYYSGEAESPLTDEERSMLAAHVATWTTKLHDRCEPYAWSEEAKGLVIRGMTKVAASTDDQGDFVAVVRATQELETLLPRFESVISDDYVITETRPSDAEPE
jgi:hypothetical protein